MSNEEVKVYVTLRMKSITLITVRSYSPLNTLQRALKSDMAQGRGPFQNVLRTLESQNYQLFTLLKKVDDLQEQVKTLQPQTYLHPIPKPRQGKEFHRSTSVAGWLFDEIEKLNERIPADQRKYLQFPSDIPFRRLNSDCIRELEGLLSYYIAELCGKVTSEDESSRRQRDCEKIIREARILPELAVFAQAAVQWALCMLCANKMRTMLATKTSKKAKIDNIPFEDEEGTCREGEVLVETQDASQHHLVHEEIENNCDVLVASDEEERLSGSEIEDAMEPDQDQGYFDGKEHSSNELLEDFPCFQEMDITERQELNEGCENISQRFQPMTGSQVETEKAQNHSRAEIQAAAQMAASRLLDTQKGSTYHHERVFNRSVQECQPALHPSVASSEKPVSDEVVKRTSSQSGRKNAPRPISKNRNNESAKRTLKSAKSLSSAGPRQSRFVAVQDGEENIQMQVRLRSGNRILARSTPFKPKTGRGKIVKKTAHAARVRQNEDTLQHHKRIPIPSDVTRKTSAKSKGIVKGACRSNVPDHRKESARRRAGCTPIDSAERATSAIAARPVRSKSRQSSR